MDRVHPPLVAGHTAAPGLVPALTREGRENVKGQLSKKDSKENAALFFGMHRILVLDIHNITL